MFIIVNISKAWGDYIAGGLWWAWVSLNSGFNLRFTYT